MALWRLAERKKTDAPAFAATLAELERDRAWLASRLRKTRERERAPGTRRAIRAERKALLATRAEFDRQRVALAVHEVKAIVLPSSVADRVASARPLAATLIDADGTARRRLSARPLAALRVVCARERSASRATGATEGANGSRPSSPHSASTRALTAASIAIGRPHARVVSPGHLLVASMPILLPRPATGDAKSR